MFTIVLTLLAVGFLLISVSYRHALLFNKASSMRVFLVSLFFAVMNTLMAWVALLFAEAIRGNMFFNSLLATISILVILSFKAYFNTRKSKLAEAIFDITTFRFMFFLALATSFEMFIALMGAALIEVDTYTTLALAGGLSLGFMWLGFLAGRRPTQASSIKGFILLASILYFLAAVSTLYYLL